MKLGIFDIEANGLEPDKIHCLVAAIFTGGEWRQKSTTDYKDMMRFFESCDVVAGHNIARWDIPWIERLLGIKIEAKVIDTLALSWYLYPDRIKHGLADWGEYFGVPKPPIDDWENLSIEEYLHRCQEDVKINCKLYDMQMESLRRIYEDDDNIGRFLTYLEFKMNMAALAEKSKWKLDVEKCRGYIEELESLKEVKIEELKEIMPKVEKTRTMTKPESLYKSDKTYKKPNNLFKKDGSLSAAGERFKALCDSQKLFYEDVEEVTIPNKELTVAGMNWVELVEANNLPDNHEEPIEYVYKVDEPNPNSHTQMKDYLFSLGWVPTTFTYSKKEDEDGREYTDEIPQIRTDVTGEKKLCPSVKKLFKVEPKLEALEGLSILTHRLGILNGFMVNVDDSGYIKAEIQGLTNTLRFKHKTIVNLPGVKKPYGYFVRGVLIAPEGYELCGSDMSSLEDRTKQHYMWEYDPEYVKEMQTPDFDPHLNLAEFAGALTPEQSDSHRRKAKLGKELSKAKEAGEDEGVIKELEEAYEKETDYGVTRHLYKTANYSCTYGAGGKTLSVTLDIEEEEGHSIVKAYREKNWAISAIEADQKIKFFYRLGNGDLTYKVLQGKDLIPQESDSRQERNKKYQLANQAESMWLFNPVSKFWYSLRFPKDIFSTLNQGTGVFCFDVWIKNFLKKRRQLTGQMHDEVILTVKRGYREQVEELLQDAIILANKQLKLNRELGIDVQFGDSYAEIH